MLTPSEQETWKDYKVFKSVTWVGPEGPAQTPEGWLVLPEGASVDMILPEKCVGWFEHNRESLELLTNLPKDRVSITLQSNQNASTQRITR